MKSVKNFKKICLVAIATICATLFLSCESTNVSGNEKELLSTFSKEWIENIFSKTEQLGYFFTTPELGQFNMIEGEFKKSGGYENSAFGFVFGYSSNEEGILSDYLRFEITTAGEYAAYACKGSTYIDLVEANDKNTAYMYPSSAIVGGYDSANKLKIEKADDTSYNLYINGTQVNTITVPEGFGNSDGVMAFFSVGKQNQEQFPDNPVRVTYRITDFQIAGEAK